MSEVPSKKNPPVKETKKKPEAKTKSEQTEGRARAKTTIFEGKKPMEKTQPNKIVATGIGENKFSNLLSMFDKNKRGSCEDIKDPSNDIEKPKVGTLNPQRFGSFSNTQSTTSQQPAEKEPVIKTTLSIKERLELLKQEGEKTATKGTKVVDPVLEMNNDAEEDENHEENLELDDNEIQEEEKIDENLGLGDDIDNINLED